MEYTGKAGRKKMTDRQKGLAAGAANAGGMLPVAPDGLCEEALEEWQRVGEYLLRTDRVAKVDTQALTYYVTSYATFADAARQLMIGRVPLWSFIRGRAKPAKVFDVMAAHATIVIKVARKFGMTARTRHLDHSSGAGRPATPDQIRALRGTMATSGRKPKNVSGGWDAASIAMPSWFSREAAAEWNKLVDSLDGLDLWTPLDVGPIAVLVACYTIAGKCATQMTEEQLVVPVEGGEGTVEHPLGIVYRQLFDICESCWIDYGMTPFDRVKFSHVDGDSQGKPKLAFFPGENAG